MPASGTSDVVLIDEICARRKEESRWVEALKYQERALLLRKDVYGLDSEEVSKCRHRIPVRPVEGKGIGFLEMAALKQGPALLRGKA